MSRTIKIILVSLFISGFVVAGGLAADYGLDKTRDRAGLPRTIAGASTIPEIIGQIVSVGLSLLGIVFFILILYAGLTWMTATGNTEKIDKAKNTLETAAIGLIIVVAAYAIASFVFTKLSSGAETAGIGSGTAVCAVGSTEGETVCGVNQVCECGKRPGDKCDVVGKCMDKCAYLTAKALLKNGVCTDVSKNSGHCPTGKAKWNTYCPANDDNAMACCADQ